MAEDFAADLDRMQADCLAYLKEAMPRSEMGRALMAELAAEDARERASRACHNCVHFSAHREESGCWNATCLAWHWNGDESEKEPAQLLRTAASCDDYEEVDDGQEGVEG